MSKISAYQLFVLIVYYQLGTTILTGFASGAGRDGWLASLISMVIGLCIILIYLWLMRLNPGLTFIEWYPKQFGQYLGTFIAWQYPLLFIYYIGRIVVDVHLLIGNILLPYTSELLISGVFLLLIGYIVFCGIETMGKLGEVIFPSLILLFIIEIFLLQTTNLMHFDNILPIANQGFSKIFESIIPTGITQTYGQTLEFSLLWVLVEDKKKAAKATIIATIISGLIITIFDFVAIWVLGETIYKSSIFPMYTLIQQIRAFAFIENLDALGILYITTTMMFKTSIHLYVLTQMLQKLTYTKSNKIYILPCILISLLMGFTMSHNPVDHFYIAFNRFSQYLWIYPLFLYPGILLVVTLIRKKISRS
jgi:spore germination protein KB